MEKGINSIKLHNLYTTTVMGQDKKSLINYEFEELAEYLAECAPTEKERKEIEEARKLDKLKTKK